MEKLESSIVRIRTANGNLEVFGTGFLIAEEQVVTCAHVVARALGLPDDHPEMPSANVYLEFPLIPSHPILSGHVVNWQPPKQDGSGDVVVVKLDDKLPDSAQTVDLVREDDLWKHRFRVFGFPVRHDNGVWAHGMLCARQATGWVQIEMQNPNYRVESGFSGAPVWDEKLNAVVGMIVASEIHPDINAAFMLPTTMLADACNKIKPVPVPTPPMPVPRVSHIQESYTNFNGMKFALVPKGEFMMGSEEDDWERPVHKVTISKSFYLGVYPVTQREWFAVMKKNPPLLFMGHDLLPIETVSWNYVQEFIKKLNTNEGKNVYRLPSEAEWEYAARAGTNTKYSFGDDESKLGEYAWYWENSGSRPPKEGNYFGVDKKDWYKNKWNGKTHPVGEKKPNPWGLHDIHGNVWEWVQDKWYGDYHDAPDDGSAWEGRLSSYRVLRGGSWRHGASNCRSTYRHHRAPDKKGGALGFRLLREM